MNEAFLLKLLSLAPHQPSLKQGKLDLKADLNEEAPMKVQQHIHVNGSSLFFPWMDFLI